jgi:hypothetical protein
MKRLLLLVGGLALGAIAAGAPTTIGNGTLTDVSTAAGVSATGSLPPVLAQCASQLGVSPGSPPSLSQLSASQQIALKQCVAAAGGPAVAPLPPVLAQCASQLGVSLGSPPSLSQLSASQQIALKQCVAAMTP